jgi:hypothetical protein
MEAKPHRRALAADARGFGVERGDARLRLFELGIQRVKAEHGVVGTLRQCCVRATKLVCALSR